MKTNHVNQVAAFEQLLGFCNAHGSVFNPSKNAIKITALGDLLTQARQAMEVVKATQTANVSAVIARRVAHRQIPQLLTRIVNALACSEVSEEVVEKAKALRKLLVATGRSRGPIPSGEQTPSTPAEHIRSASKLTYTQRVDNLAIMVHLLSREPNYCPNEADLQVTALTEHVTFLRDLNKSVYDSEVALSNARFSRNKALYGEGGIHESAGLVKMYMKSLFGAQSVPFRQVNRLRFRDQKI